MYKNYKAETVDHAIALGLEELKVAEEDIKIDVLEGGSKGFLGLGRKDAEVRLTVINPELKSYETIEAVINRDKPKEEKSVVDEVLEERNEEDTAVTDDRKEAMDEKAAEKDAAAEESVVTEEDDEKKESDDLTFDEAISKTADYLRNVIEGMNIDNTATYKENNNTAYIELESELAAKLIGKRGQTLNALQEIGQNYLNTVYRSFGVIVLDIENYRDKRRQTLENLAVNMSKKAIRTEQPVKLEPMPSFERKIMHNVLGDSENISTRSEGNEPNRYLVIEKK